MDIKKLTIILLLPLVLLSACRKSPEASWEISAYGPLLKTSLTVRSIVPDSMLLADADDLLWLVHRFSFYDFSFDELVNIPDTISHAYLPPLGGVTLNPGQLFYDLTDNTSLNLGDAQLSRLDIRSGYVVVQVYSTITQPSDVTYRIPCATRDGQYFEMKETVPAATASQAVFHTIKVDISGYSIDMKGPSGLSYNILTNRTLARLSADANPVTLTDNDKFIFYIRFEDMVVQYARGYFGSNDYSFGPDTSDVSFFDMVSSGTFDLEQATMSLEVENRYGADLRAAFDQLTSINSMTGQTVDLNCPVIGQILNISRASEYGGSPVVASSYIYPFDHSNLADLIDNMPDQLAYKVRIYSNPLGNISAGNDFVYYGNYLSAWLNMEIPLSLKTNNLTLRDTLDIFPGNDPGTLSTAVFRLYADNGFPFSAQIQFYLLDTLGNVTDSLLTGQTIQAPDLDANYRVVEPRRTEFLVEVPQPRLKSFFNTRRIAVQAVFNTNGAGHYVKIYSHYKLDLKLVGDVRYLIKT